MNLEPINTSALETFIKQLKNAELSKQKEISINVQQSKVLVYTLTLLLNRYNANLENFINTTKETEVIQVSLDGGKNW